jgi:peptide/nickel transport system substrate-binding protein
MDRGALVLQQQLEAIGIKSEIISFDWATHMAFRVDPAGYDLYTTSYSTVPVPSLKLYYAIAEPGWPEDPTLQKYLADFNSAISRAEARERWEILQAYSWEHIPAINMGHYVACLAWSKKVENLSVYNGLYFWNTSVRK